MSSASWSRTEGWPTGLYLAALAMNAGSPHLAAASSFSGTDRFVAEYLRSEFLDRVSRSDVLFLTRTSILDRMCGPLCDATVGRTGSSRVLQRLEQRNLLVIPIDRDSEWYRYHHLFGELLHAELMRREPEMVRELHLRAAAWYEANNLPEAAVEHAQRAADADLAARLVLTLANPVWASGRLDTVLRWMQWFADHELMEEQPAVAVHGALLLALVGNAPAAERWADAAQHTTRTGTLSDGNTMEGTLAYLRTLICRDGLEEMRLDAQTALQGLSPTSPYRPAMLHAEGAAHLLGGDADLADGCLRAGRGGSQQHRRDSLHSSALGRARHCRDRAGRLVVRRGARVTGTRDHAARVRQLLDECPPLCLGCPRGGARTDLTSGA